MTSSFDVSRVLTQVAERLGSAVVDDLCPLLAKQIGYRPARELAEVSEAYRRADFAARVPIEQPFSFLRGVSGDSEFTGVEYKTGTYTRFRLDDVVSWPLLDHSGNTIGISFQARPIDVIVAKKAAVATIRKIDETVYTVLPEEGGAFAQPKKSLWSGRESKPIYIDMHSDRGKAEVPVDFGSRGQPDVRFIDVEDREFARVLMGTRHFWRALDHNPSGPMVLWGCAADPVAGGLARYFHDEVGLLRDVYAASREVHVGVLGDKDLDAYLGDPGIAGDEPVSMVGVRRAGPGDDRPDWLSHLAPFSPWGKQGT
ncbi:hypothetical protein AB0B25_13010 [Nocardia sp. NPDC049190]|uniref:hypothetical protein n=1 Tax=Nocardia sp. NPDC049190 TaxID=3155650 RepID=UPI0034115D1D